MSFVVVETFAHSMMATLSQTKELLRRADAVCFDVDSTVIKEEGIDELAKFCGVGDAVTEMTRNAMGGSMTFKTALTERLSIIRCSREQVNKLITDHPPQLTPGISMMATLSQTKELLRRADAVCFDVDSTVIKEEGIDELAKFCGVGDAVTEMTRNAMGGSMTFKTALTERLSIIRCSREQVNKLITDHPPQLTPGIRELVEHLHQRNIKVFLISGGFRCIVEHVAAQLNIPLHHVYANRLKFYFNGEYAGFDESQPTAESGGKGKVISMLKEQYGFKTVVMIGDGATDLEACPPASAFIGFGGNVIRPQVKERSSWYVTSFGELLKELEKI
ncbi:phosphoserine phosphatase isoform X2 [Siniperca chuatsi]|uniref:phosphoserine phosphatase isoform X2 n=1 Tax=Siniperca chuatsi TaxID=119488 RepID=UPI001CE06D7D|nr:phosphoserine phosphatase isoform X2 [Siniperca chuatsi]